MAAEIPVTPSASGKASAAQMQQLENALNQIGVTRSHKSIIFLVVCGVLFDVFEQNAVGLVGPLLRQQWGLDATDIAFLNTITFFISSLLLRDIAHMFFLPCWHTYLSWQMSWKSQQ